MFTAQEAAQAEDGMGQKKVINLLPLNVSSTRIFGMSFFMASQPTPPNVPPLRNKGLIRPY